MSHEPPPPAEVGLDDLFGRSGGSSPWFPAGSSSQTSGATWLLGRLLFSLAVSAVIYGLLYFMHLVVPFPLLVATIFVITLIKYVLAGVAAGPLPRQLTGRGIRPMDEDLSAVAAVDAAQDGIAVAVGRWTSRLGSAGEGRRGRAAQPTWLGELVDERLRLHHGFTRATDPRRAREMMGEHLWRMLHNPSAGGPTPRDMATMVKWIEEL